ncbi:radical SAM protein [Chryseobacterium antibioticum]|uniref:Radical SAM protein n=1 Tax=Chryseobacterium pyrolae TaxID=2987481 RepID=A0ABT2IDZ3_9FLAO|nr:radical SAM protein [Chryseobacterium pyrolae]MCT2406848.1 radical SAM protein [Chryseobacterium pyrolae]
MKASQFNSFFFYEEKQIGYNAFTNEFLLLEPELYDLYNAAKHENNWKELQTIHHDFHSFLVDKGFIVDENDNEVEKVKDLVQKIDKDNDELFELTINPTMNCNFKCWYCYETHIKASKMSKETINNIISLVDNILIDKPNLKEFHLQWFGGEPLLYFDATVVPLLKGIYPKMIERGIAFSSGFTSNGLLINQNMLDVCKSLGVNHFQITLDGHRERHNQVRYVSKERGSYDEIVNNIKLCTKNEITTSARINVSEETLDNLSKILDDFIDLDDKSKEYLNFSFHEVWQEEKDIDSDIQNEVNLFRDHGLNTLYKGVNLDTVRSSCYADKKNHATINYNGEVFKCTARDFESESREGLLNSNGVIEWNEKYENRMNSKFKNAPCLSCKILPICNGGCSQQAIEHKGREYCVHGFDENKKLEVIKDKFLYAIS